MGRKKKTQPKPKKKMVIRYRVKKDKQHRDFKYQSEARAHLIECLRDGAITFCSIKKVEVEDC